MKQAERIRETSFFVEHKGYQSSMPLEFKTAAKVFIDVLNVYDGAVRNPSIKELNNLSSELDDDFEIYFYVKQLNLNEFAELLSAEVYATIEHGMNDDANRAANFEDYNKWCDFVNHFDEKKFSKLFQKFLLTNRAVRSFVQFDGTKTLEIGSGYRLWDFVDDYSSNFLRGKITQC